MSIWHKWFGSSEKQQSDKQKIVVKHQHRTWDAAKNDRLLADWGVTSQPINSQLKMALVKLRARSRDLAKNDHNVKRFLQMVKNNVVGAQGISLQANILERNDPEKRDRVASKAIEKGWKKFSKKGQFEITGRLSRVSFEKLYLESLLRDGEVLGLITEGKTANNDFYFGVRMLDPELLPVHYNGQYGKNKIVMGVERDGMGGVVAYHLTAKDARADNAYTVGRNNYIRIKAEYVFHEFLVEYVDQDRGIPQTVTAATRIRMLNGYEEAEIVAARVSANKIGAYQRKEGAEEWTGEQDEAGNYLEDSEAGEFGFVPDGYELKMHDPSHPSTAFEPFRKSINRSIASALGVSYNSLSNDLEGVNYSSLRQGTLDEREVYTGLQRILVDFYERIYPIWLTWSLTAGAITTEAGGTLRRSDYDRYLNVSWQGRTWPWVDPLKDMTANEKAIKLRVSSRSDVIRQSGRDPDLVFEEIAKEEARMEELGINFELKEPAKAGFINPEESEEDDNANKESDS